MTNADQPLGPANLIGLMFLGFALLWTVKLVYAGRRADRDWLRRVLNLAGTILILFGGAGLLLSVAGAPAFWLLLLGAIVTVMAVGRFRASERRALLWMLASASEKAIPLPVAVRVFADRRDDEMGDRFVRMAELLEAGVTLPWALERSGNRVPTDLRAAVDLGEQSGALGPSLRAMLERIDESELALRRLVERYLYLGVVFGIASGVFSFMVLKLLPTMAAMLEEFEIEPPGVTKYAFAAAEMAATWQPLWFAGLAVIWLGLLLMFVYYIGWLPSDVLFLDRLMISVDRAAVMRSLAIAVRGRRPLAEAVRVLSWRYPKRLLRVRLERASRKIDAGGDWREALRSARLIRSSEAAVFASAEKVGNLAWALDEMADAAQRRLALRLRTGLAVLFPLLILAFGGMVLFAALSLLIPLNSIVQALA